MVTITLTGKCARTRLRSWFSLKGSCASIQKIRGVTKPHDHHWKRETTRERLQLPDERPGRANNTPRALHTRIAAIQAAQRFFIPKLYNTGNNAVENTSCQCPANRGTYPGKSGLG